MDLINYKDRLINDHYPPEFIEDMEVLLDRYQGSDFKCSFFESFSEIRDRKSLRFNSYKIVRDYLAERGELGVLENIDQAAYLKIADIAVERFAEKFFADLAVSDKISKVSWSSYGYYYPKSLVLSKCPEYQSGYFYIQEASAMIPGEILANKVFGKNVADLCAAPGGKSLRLAEAIVKDGILVSNDYSRSRAKVLRFNIRQLGLNNVAVISSDPVNMINQMKGSFDAVILDAPCSGEGMMRRNKESRLARAKYPIKDLVELQAGLLDTAAQLLKEGGFLVYSTCTFNIHENEEQIVDFLERHRDFKIERIDSEVLKDNKSLSKGIDIDSKYDLSSAIRVFPNVAEGDGHFAVLLKKAPPSQSDGFDYTVACEDERTVNSFNRAAEASKSIIKSNAGSNSKKNKKKVVEKKGKRGQDISIDSARRALQNFIEKNLTEDIYSLLGRAFFYRLDLVDNTVILRMEKGLFESSRDIHVLYSGMSFGELKIDKKGSETLIPNHDLCLSFPITIFKAKIDCRNDDLLNKFVSGQTLSLTELDEENRDRILASGADYIVFSYRGILLGMLKRQENILKNMYPRYLHGKFAQTETDFFEE